MVKKDLEVTGVRLEILVQMVPLVLEEKKETLVSRVL
jgi:hypothetical protein